MAITHFSVEGKSFNIPAKVFINLNNPCFGGIAQGGENGPHEFSGGKHILADMVELACKLLEIPPGILFYHLVLSQLGDLKELFGRPHDLHGDSINEEMR